MDRPKLHLIAPAGSCRRFFEEIGVATAAELIAIVQEAVGSDYHVTGDEAVIAGHEDEFSGGRYDDRLRAQDIERALADCDVVAMVALRGGSWLTRILPLIDFSVVDQRTRPIAVFGFSELTTLVNIVGAHQLGRGVYDLAPVFLSYGLRHANSEPRTSVRAESARAEALGSSADDRSPPTSKCQDPRLRTEFRAFFRDVVSMIEGRGTHRKLSARIVRGRLPDRLSATFVGGNLCVLTTLLGSPYRDCIAPSRGSGSQSVSRWLVLEEFNERPYRLDRFLAQLTLAGYWNECEGLLLGDFHKGDLDLGPAMESLLAYHLPPERSIPVLVTNQVGHVWPMSPLPLHECVTLERIDSDRYSIDWPASALRVV